VLPEQSEKDRGFRFTEHAAFAIKRRGLDIVVVRQVLSRPGQVHEVRPGRHVFQSIVSLGEPPRDYLIRVFVDTDRDPFEVVTAYKTGKISKYWRTENEGDV